jgi:hypothetical protein
MMSRLNGANKTSSVKKLENWVKMQFILEEFPRSVLSISALKTFHFYLLFINQVVFGEMTRGFFLFLQSPCVQNCEFNELSQFPLAIYHETTRGVDTLIPSRCFSFSAFMALFLLSLS